MAFHRLISVVRLYRCEELDDETDTYNALNSYVENLLCVTIVTVCIKSA